MFQDIDTTLAELLRVELPSDVARHVSISFATPDSAFPPSWVELPSINFFLYQAQPNWEMRNNEPTMERQLDGNVARVPAPARVNCHFLVTAWAKTGVAHSEDDEHRLLGETMRILMRHRELPRQALRGGLRGHMTPVRAIVQAGVPGPFDIWQALGSRPRAAFQYSITVPMDIHPPEIEGRMVGA